MRRPRLPDDASNFNQQWVPLRNSSPNPAALGGWTISDAADDT